MISRRDGSSHKVGDEVSAPSGRLHSQRGKIVDYHAEHHDEHGRPHSLAVDFGNNFLVALHEANNQTHVLQIRTVEHVQHVAYAERNQADGKVANDIEYDGQRQDRPNLYGVPYGPEWHMKRAESLDQWRQKYGGNIHIMCVEFGCMDAETPKVLWRSAVDGSGISPEVRLQFTKDMRSSFDAYDIGWSYWSYNEAHTIFQIDAHSYGTSPDPEVAANMFDYEMLEEGLGVTPLVEPGEIVTIETDPDWLVIDNFESVGSWYGTGLQVSNDKAPSGYGWLRTESVDAGNAAVFANALPQKKDVSAYSNGYLHVWVYVEDIEKITGGQIELCSSGVPDMYETSWDLKKYVTSSGWNELYLPLADASTGQKAADLKAIDFIRIYALVTEAMPVGVDQMYLCTKMP